MGGDLTGDFAKLREALRELRLSPMEEHRRLVSVDLLQLVDSGFTSKSMPYGQTWQPSKSNGNTLEKSGALRSRIKVRRSGPEITITSGARYGLYHQGGALLRGRKQKFLFSGPVREGGRHRARRLKQTGSERGMLPQRAFLPGSTMPPRWGSRISTTCNVVMKKHFRSAGG